MQCSAPRHAVGPGASAGAPRFRRSAPRRVRPMRSSPLGPATQPTRPTWHIRICQANIHHGPSPAGPQRRWTSEEACEAVQKTRKRRAKTQRQRLTVSWMSFPSTVPRQAVEDPKALGQKSSKVIKGPDGNRSQDIPSSPRIQNFIAVIIIVLILWCVWLGLVKFIEHLASCPHPENS